MAPRALQWDSVNWSCAYDAFLNLMWNLYGKIGHERFENIYPLDVEMKRLTAVFSQVSEGLLTLEAARSTVREHLTLKDSQRFPLYGHIPIAVDNVFAAFLSMPLQTLTLTCTLAQCSSCGYQANEIYTLPCPSIWESLAIEDSAAQRSTSLSMDAVISDLLNSAFSRRCTVCRSHVPSSTVFSDVPELFVVNLNRRSTTRVPLYINPTVVLPTTQQNGKLLRILGIVYWGANHFTTQLIDRDDTVWYNDGAQTSMRSHYQRRGTISTTNLTECENRIPRLIIYHTR
ncbi:hypothetical protein BDW22DRAFT_1333009 [Trametopsis cervina]|nr:hypothetical protein BDW22DRAFT_1333009 [Trametopsis cervina]